MEYTNRWIDFLYENNQDKFRQDEMNTIGALHFHSTSIFPRCLQRDGCRSSSGSENDFRAARDKEERAYTVEEDPIPGKRCICPPRAAPARGSLAPFMSVSGHEMATKRSRAARTSRNNAPSPSLCRRRGERSRSADDQRGGNWIVGSFLLRLSCISGMKMDGQTEKQSKSQSVRRRRGGTGCVQRWDKNVIPRLGEFFQASWGRSGKQQQDPNSRDLDTTF